MIEEMVNDYAAYLKLDVTNGFNALQDVIDNMLTRLEELTSVLQMIRAKNNDCNAIVTEDIKVYRTEINILSKKIVTLSEVLLKLQHNVELVERQVDKAEIDFGVNTDNRLKSLLKPFLKRNKEPAADHVFSVPDKLNLPSVLNNFEENKS